MNKYALKRNDTSGHYVWRNLVRVDVVSAQHGYATWNGFNPKLHLTEADNVSDAIEKFDLTPYTPAFKPAVEAKPSVPQEVSARQLRLALLDVNVTPTLVEANLNKLPVGKARTQALIEWEYATTIRRDHPLVEALAPALRMNTDALDKLFIEAAKK